MTQSLRHLARKLGDPLGRGSAAITDADLLELIARAEHLAEMIERMVCLSRTVLHTAEDGQPLTYPEAVCYANTLEITVSEVAEFRAVVSAIKTAIPTH